MTHSFVDTNFSRPTYCDHCQGLLWGLVKQGTTCSGCGVVCHHDCQKNISACPNTPTTPTINRKSFSNSPAAKSLRTLQQNHSSDSLISNTSSLQKLKHIATSEDFHNVIVSAAINSTDTTQPPNEYLANLPPLNPQNTAKNFSRFVSRCGPLFAFRDSVILLLSWHKPIDTLVALFLYILVCLHPKLVLLVPHMILIQIIITGYYKKKGIYKDNIQTENDVQQPQIKEPASHTRFGFAAAFFPAFDEASPEYLKNMQNLQNMMGESSDLYDLCAANAHYVNWSSEADTMRVFQGALISFCLLSFGIWFLPLNIIFLIGGVSMFLINTRFAKFVLKEMLPQIAEIGQSQMNSAVEWYNNVEKKLDDQDNFQELSLYENQRWWPDSGFIPHMHLGERGLWSNYSGNVELAPKEELPAPKGYHWIEDNWSLDQEGPWMDDTLGLAKVEVMVYPENGGWVYTDNNWENPRKSKSTLDTPSEGKTRRRRWTRKCELDLIKRNILD